MKRLVKDTTQHLFVFILLVTTLFVFAGCAPAQENPAEQSIKIGVNFPLTGGLAVYGVPLLEGFSLGIEEVNAGGGVNGRMLKIMVEDNMGDPRSAINAAQKLINTDHVHIMVTTLVGPTGAIAPITEENHVSLLYAAATDTFAEKNHYVFKDSVDAYYDCQVFTREAAKRGMHNIALFGTIAEFTEDCKRALQEEPSQQGKLVLYETYSKGDNDFRTQLTKLQAQKPDAIFLSAYSDDCILIWRQIQELGIQIPFMLPFTQTGCGEERAMKEVSTNFPGKIIGLDFRVNKSDKKYQDFITHFHEKYNKEPDLPFFTTLAYDWAHYIAQAFERCPDPADKECLKASMEKVDYEGALGSVKFKSTHATFRPRVPIEYRHGDWTLVSDTTVGLSMS